MCKVTLRLQVAEPKIITDCYGIRPVLYGRPLIGPTPQLRILKHLKRCSHVFKIG